MTNEHHDYPVLEHVITVTEFVKMVEDATSQTISPRHARRLCEQNILLHRQTDKNIILIDKRSAEAYIAKRKKEERHDT